MNEKRQVTLNIENVFFARLALHEKVKQYQELVKQESARAYSQDQQDRLSGLKYFQHGFEGAYEVMRKAVGLFSDGGKIVSEMSANKPTESEKT